MVSFDNTPFYGSLKGVKGINFGLWRLRMRLVIFRLGVKGLRCVFGIEVVF